MRTNLLFDARATSCPAPWRLAFAVTLAAATGCGANEEGMGDAGAGGGDAGACEEPSGGRLGDPCLASEECSCDLVCELGACARPLACDEALLTWDAPVDREDGTCLPHEELDGFSLHWSMDAEAIGTSEANTEDLGMPCVEADEVSCGSEGETVTQLRCSYRLTDLPEGEVFFALRVRASDGLESAFSATASKVIDCE